MLEIIPYKTNWPAEFREIALVLRQGLGGLALRIDHIGSTSVPGLAAMTTLGYTRPEGTWRDHPPAGLDHAARQWEKWFFRVPPGQRPTHTHVRIQDRANQRYPLLFRDYLRTHPDTAQSYAELKRRLAANLADPQTYPAVKDPAVDLIYWAAEEWATASHWHPGPSDA
jgi:GrpB-like predicted nucleotidyltransferase (UPF0157 family)